MSGLEIPERALQVACDAYDGALGLEFRTVNAQWSGGEHAEHAAVRAAAPIIVAHFIRHRLMPESDDVALMAWLDMYARELDPEGNTA